MDFFSVTTAVARTAAFSCFEIIKQIDPLKPIKDLLNIFTGNTDTIKAQQDTPVEIIKAARDRRAKSIEIEMDHLAVIDFQVPVEGTEIASKMGKHGETII
jgi:hypothetical protein